MNEPECIGVNPKQYRLAICSTVVTAVGPLADDMLRMLATAVKRTTAGELCKPRPPAPPGLLAAMEETVAAYSSD